MRAAGFGFRRAAPIESLRAALALAGGDVAVLATAESKVPVLQALAQEMGVPVIGVAAQLLAAQAVGGSSRVMALYGTGSVAQAAALAAVGQGGRLVGERVISPDRTVVVAIAEQAE